MKPIKETNFSTHNLTGIWHYSSNKKGERRLSYVLFVFTYMTRNLFLPFLYVVLREGSDHF